MLTVLSRGKEPAPHAIAPRPIQSESCNKLSRPFIHLRSNGPSHCFLLPCFLNSYEMFGPSLVFCCPFDCHHAATYRTGLWSAVLGQSSTCSVASDRWNAWVGLRVKKLVFRKWPAVTQQKCSQASWGSLRIAEKSAPRPIKQGFSWQRRACTAKRPRSES